MCGAFSRTESVELNRFERLIKRGERKNGSYEKEKFMETFSRWSNRNRFNGKCHQLTASPNMSGFLIFSFWLSACAGCRPVRQSTTRKVLQSLSKSCWRCHHNGYPMDAIRWIDFEWKSLTHESLTNETNEIHLLHMTNVSRETNSLMENEEAMTLWGGFHRVRGSGSGLMLNVLPNLQRSLSLDRRSRF